MSVDQIHAVLSLTFVAVWAMIGQFVTRDR